MSRTLAVGLVLLLAMVSVSYAEYVSPREQQKAYAPLMVELPLGNLTLTEQQFQDAARRAFSRRRWNVLDAKGNLATAELERKGAIYRVDMENKGSSIEIRFQPEYSDKRTNYLMNLRRDLAFELRIND
jgi:hypothetical protein